jgi:hypothetical integral membrane protein (TIGR02206 family)
MDLSTEHLLAVAAIAICAASVMAAARLRRGYWTRVVGLALAVLLVGAEVGWWIYLAATGAKDEQLGSAIPLQLCDAAIFISAFALVLRTQLLVEMTYFWGLAGTIHAVITPDQLHFPSFPFVQYYVGHGGVVLAALFLVVGLGQWPRRDAFFRVVVITVAYTLVVGAIDAATGANYMFLRNKPPSASLLDLLGPWPLYLAWAGLIGVASLLILDAPFRWLRHIASMRAQARSVSPVGQEEHTG